MTSDKWLRWGWERQISVLNVRIGKALQAILRLLNKYWVNVPYKWFIDTSRGAGSVKGVGVLGVLFSGNSANYMWRCVFFGNAFPPFIKKSSVWFLFCHFAHFFFQKWITENPFVPHPFCFHWCVRSHVLRIVMVEHKWVHKLSQTRRFGRLYACCISLTQVFNKMIWFIPLEVNNFGHESAAGCVIWKMLSKAL